MPNIKTVLVALITVLVVTGVVPHRATAQEVLTVESIVRQVAESDPTVINSRRTVEEARENYALTRAGVRPNLDLEVTPYRWDQRRVITGPDTELLETTSVGLGLTLDQPLTTSGTLSAGVRNRLDVTSNDTVEQVPEVTLGLNQPLFVAGNLITTEVYRAGLRAAEIAVEQAEVRDRITTNGNIQRALGLYVRVGSLRRSILVLNRTIDVLQRQLESAELDRQQGLISNNALLALQVTLNNRREALLDTELGLVQAEQDLARALGRRSLEEGPLAEGFPAPSVASYDDADSAPESSPDLALQSLSVEQTERNALLNDLQDRPRLSLAFRAAPVYPETRSEPDDLSSSFDDLFADGSDWEASFSVDVIVPLLSGRERSSRERIDELSRLRATTTLEDTERAVINRLETLLTNREFLTQRRELLQVDVDYEAQRVENEETLLSAGATTALRVEEVEVDLQSRRNELWQVEAELFLNAVDILALAGEDLSEVLTTDR